MGERELEAGGHGGVCFQVVPRMGEVAGSADGKHGFHPDHLVKYECCERGITRTSEEKFRARASEHIKGEECGWAAWI